LAWSTFGFFWGTIGPRAVHSFADWEHIDCPGLGCPRAERESRTNEIFQDIHQAHNNLSPCVWVFHDMCSDTIFSQRQLVEAGEHFMLC
jgi:hypothetical protein